jgi:hypothetical protein
MDAHVDIDELGNMMTLLDEETWRPWLRIMKDYCHVFTLVVMCYIYYRYVFLLAVIWVF